MYTENIINKIMEASFMKKVVVSFLSIVSLGSIGFSTLNSLTSSHMSEPLTIFAQSNLDFEQGDRSDEEYVDYVLSQFQEVDAYITESNITFGGTTSIRSIIDNTQGAYLTEFLNAEGEVDYIAYTYPDRMLVDQVGFYRASEEFLLSMDPEFSDKLKALEEATNGRLVEQTPEDVEITEQLQSIDSFLELPTEINYTNDGGVVTASAVLTGDQLSEFIGSSIITPNDQSELTIEFVINPNEQVVTQNVTLTIPNEETEESGETLGISVSLPELIEITSTYAPTDERVPAESEIEYMTTEEFNALTEEVGIQY